MKITRDDLIQGTANCLVVAGSSYTPDRLAAYARAIESEELPNSKWFLQILKENAEIAEVRRLPLCDDTGIPHVILRVGEECELPAGWLKAVEIGVAEGLKTLPGRPMAVRGDDVQRVEQSCGLYPESEALLPAPIRVMSVPGDKVEIAVLLLGGGPEIRARTRRIFHKRSMERVINEVISWLCEEAAALGCTPMIPAVGIGRTQVEASALMLEAMAFGTLDEQNEWEQKVTNAINETNVGPLGLGGKSTAMGCFMKVGPIRASGVRIACARPCCTMEPRVGRTVLG